MLQVSKPPVSMKTPARRRNMPADRGDSSFVTTAIAVAIFCGLGLAASLAVYAMAPAEMIAVMTHLE